MPGCNHHACMPRWTSDARELARVFELQLLHHLPSCLQCHGCCSRLCACVVALCAIHPPPCNCSACMLCLFCLRRSTCRVLGSTTMLAWTSRVMGCADGWHLLHAHAAQLCMCGPIRTASCSRSARVFDQHSGSTRRLLATRPNTHW